MLVERLNVFSLCLSYSSYEHIVYALDGLMYTLTYWPTEATQLCKLEQIVATPTKTDEVDMIKKKFGMDSSEPKDLKYFLRTESLRAKEEVEKSNEQFFATASSPGPNHDLYQEPFPFAKQPHLLQSFASKQQLFSSPHTSLEGKGPSNGTSDSNQEERMETSSSEQSILSYSHLNKR